MLPTLNYGERRPRKLAVTERAAFMLTVQVFPEVLSQPLHPVKRLSMPGLAVSVTVVPLMNDAEQLLPQLIPAGFEVTVPLPRPVF